MQENTEHIQAEVQGGCLCGTVRYAVKPPFKLFQYCHCSRCQKATGTAHAANAFLPLDQFRWISGDDNLSDYSLPEAKYFGTSFCKTCGSNMPIIIEASAMALVPAGGLEGLSDSQPEQSIFWGSKAEWYLSPSDLPRFDKLPARSTK